MPVIPQNPLIVPSAPQTVFAGIVMGIGDIAFDRTLGGVRIGDGVTPGGLFLPNLQQLVQDLSLNSDVPYRATLAEAVAEFEAGAYFKTDDKAGAGPHPGVTWIFKRTPTTPFYEAQIPGSITLDVLSDATVAAVEVATEIALQAQEGAVAAEEGAAEIRDQAGVSIAAFAQTATQAVTATRDASVTTVQQTTQTGVAALGAIQDATEDVLATAQEVLGTTQGTLAATVIVKTDTGAIRDQAATIKAETAVIRDAALAAFGIDPRFIQFNTATPTVPPAAVVSGAVYYALTPARDRLQGYTNNSGTGVLVVGMVIYLGAVIDTVRQSTPKEISGAYTLVPDDSGRTLVCTAATAVIVPAGFGGWCRITKRGAFTATVTSGVGATLHSATTGYDVSAPFDEITVFSLGSEEYAVAHAVVTTTDDLSMNLAAAAYVGPASLAISSPTDDITINSFTRASVAYAEEANGNWKSFANDQPRITDQGLLVEDTAATNIVLNNSMTGAVAGTPGTMPTGWPAISAGVLSSEIISVGPDPVTGFQRLRCRVFGTVGATGITGSVRMLPATGAAVTPGDQMIGTAYFATVAAPNPVTSVVLRTSARNSAGSAVDVGVSASLLPVPSAWRRAATSAYTVGAGYVWGDLSLIFVAAANQVVNWTFDIAIPQMEKLPASGLPSSPIPTTNGAATRAAEVINYADRSLLQTTRTSIAYAEQANGNWKKFAANRPRITDKGLKVEPEGATNVVPNSIFAGAVAGSPGTMPLGIPTPTMGVLSYQVVGVTDDPITGFKKLRMRVYGTAGGTGIAGSIRLMSSTAQVTAAGEKWIGSAWFATVDATHPVNAPYLRVRATNASGSSSDPNAAVTANYLAERDTVWRRRVVPLYIVPDPYVRIEFGLLFSVSANQVVDWTFDIAMPQLERANTVERPSTPIPTYGAPESRAAETVTLSGPFAQLQKAEQSTIELDVAEITMSMVDVPLLDVTHTDNSSVRGIYRAANGALASDYGSAKTKMSYRGNWFIGQTARLARTTSQIVLAHTAGESVTAQIAAPVIKTLKLKGPATFKAVRLRRAPKTDVAATKTYSADVVVYGATPGGIMAAIEAKAQGRTAIIIGGWREVQVGGMQGGGLAATDLVVQTALGGRALDLYSRLRAACNGTSTDKSFESPQYQRVFEDMLREAAVPVVWSTGVTVVQKIGAKITNFQTLDGKTVTGQVFVDSSYEGDLFAAAGCSFRLGRDAEDANNIGSGFKGNNSSSGDMGVLNHPVKVDPYVTPGNPASGTIYGVGTQPATAQGTADQAIQSFNFRLTMTKNASRALAWPNTPPPGYVKSNYELLFRNYDAVTTAGFAFTSDYTLPFNFANLVPSIPGGSNTTDANTKTGVSTNVYGANGKALSWDYALASYAQREVIWKAHESWIRGFIYAIQYEADARIPQAMRNEMLLWSQVKDHYLDPHPNDQPNWPYALYVREARRVTGEISWNLSDLQAVDGTTPRSSKIICGTSYPIDRHSVQRYARTDVAGDYVWVEGSTAAGAGDADKVAPIPYEIIVPQRTECTNLLVTFGVSCSTMAFGGIRLEPTHMMIGQAAGVAAALYCEAAGATVMQDIDYPTLKTRLLAGGAIIPTVN